MKITGGEMLVRVLEQEGVKQVFALHGGHIEPIFQACLKHSIRIIDTRHEQAAGHMADGWARVTGEIGVAMVTSGPGVTDIVTAVANTYVDSVPMLVIGGRHAVAEEERLPLQELHGLPLMESITKWSRALRDPKRIPEYVATAFRQATTGRPGPVFLEIPADVLAREVEGEDVSFPEARADAASRGVRDDDSGAGRAAGDTRRTRGLVRWRYGRVAGVRPSHNQDSGGRTSHGRTNIVSGSVLGGGQQSSSLGD